MASDFLPFKKTVAALVGDSQEFMIQQDGDISEVTMHFPPGCSGLVDVRVLYMRGSEESFVVPSVDGQYVALDSATPTYRNIGYPVKKNGRVRVEFENHDSLNPHTVSVQVVITAKIGVILPKPPI